VSVAILFGVIVAVIFAAAFVSSRRFGPLALALAAGFLLAEWWSNWLGSILDGFGMELDWLPNGVIAVLLLLLAPLFALLASGPKYQKKHMKIVSAAGIAFLAAALLVMPLGKFMSLDGQALELYKMFAGAWRYIATAGLVLGVVDLFLAHTASARTSKKH
jgi:membrane protein